jgi:F-type H+-transporting ATPase subunit b
VIVGENVLAEDLALGLGLGLASGAERAMGIYRIAERQVEVLIVIGQIPDRLEERRQRIAEGLANAEKIKADLARTEAQRQEMLEQVNAQATKLIEEARAAAARVGAQETQKAIAAAEQIMTKAREAAAADHARMLAELKREVGRLVVQATTAVTGKVLTPEDQRRLAEETSKVVAA